MKYASHNFQGHHYSLLRSSKLESTLLTHNFEHYLVLLFCLIYILCWCTVDQSGPGDSIKYVSLGYLSFSIHQGILLQCLYITCLGFVKNTSNGVCHLGRIGICFQTLYPKMKI